MPRPINKPRVLEEMGHAFEELFPKVPKGNPGVCLYWAAAAIHTLAKHKLSPQLVAGSLSWPIVPKHLDDGVSDTHFSYMYEPDHALSLLSMAKGHLPEMHVWAYLTDRREIVDPSTGFLKEHFHQMMPQLEWRTPEPPKCLWSRKLPPQVQYIANAEATAFAMKSLSNLGVSLPVPRNTSQKER